MPTLPGTNDTSLVAGRLIHSDGTIADLFLSAPPIAGQILQAVSPTLLAWSNPPAGVGVDAPANGPYLTATPSAGLSAERVLQGINHISVTDHGAIVGTFDVSWDGFVGKNSGVAVSTRRSLNLIAGTGISIFAADNVGGDSVDYTLSLSGGGASAADHAEDDPHTNGDIGSFALGVRNDAAGTTFTSTNGDYSPFAVDAQGRMGITTFGTSLPVTVGNFPDPMNVNLKQVGGTAFAQGPRTKAQSLSATIATDQGDIPVSVSSGSIQTTPKDSTPQHVIIDSSQVKIPIDMQAMYRKTHLVLTSPLGGSASVVGTSEDAIDYTNIGTVVFTDQPGTLVVEQSIDNVNWDLSQSFPVSAGVAKVVSVNLDGQYVRIRYLNGTNAQTVFRLKALLRVL